MSAADTPRDDASDDASEAADCGWSESAMLHCVGALDSDQAARFLEHTASCTRCADELAHARRDVAFADESLAREDAARSGASHASDAVRERLMRAIASTPQAGSPSHEAAPQRERDKVDRPWRRWDTAAPAGASTEGFAPGMYAIAGDGGAWEAIGIAGIDVKRLATDPARRSVTMLVRMGPGTAYPRHRHGGLEECFVLSGELQVGERTLRAGDYQLSQENSVHPVQSTREGCLLYITSSQDDELL